MSGPVNVGTTVFGLKYKDGVMFAADTSITYGSMLKIKNGKRIEQVGDETIIACSGEMADFQNIVKQMNEKHEADFIENDGATFFHPRDYFNWVARTQYQRRLKMDPLLVSGLVGGINPKTKEVFLGKSNPHGTKLEADWFITGLGDHYCQVLFQNKWRADMTEQEAVALIEECIRILFIRDKKAADHVQIATVTHQHGPRIGEAYKVPASLDYQAFYDRTNEFYRPMRIRY